MSPLDASYCPTGYFADSPRPSPAQLYAAHEARSRERARPDRVRAFRFMRDAERIVAEVTR